MIFGCLKVLDSPCMCGYLLVLPCLYMVSCPVILRVVSVVGD